MPKRWPQSSQMLRQIPLRRVLILGFVLPLIGAVGLIEYLVLQNERQTVEQLVGNIQKRIGDLIQERLRTYTMAPSKATDVLIQALQRGDLSTSNLQTWQPYLFNQGQTYDTLTYLYFGTPTGDYVELEQHANAPDEVFFIDGQNPKTQYRYSPDPSKLPLIKQRSQPYDPRRRPWYQAAINGQAQWTGVYEFLDEPKTLGISFVRPVFSNEDKTLLGVVGADFTLADFTRFLNSLTISQTGEAFVISRDGTLIASSLPDSPVDANLKAVKVLTAPNALIQSTGQFLRQQFGDFKNITQAQSLQFVKAGQRQLLQVAPFTDSYGLDWLIVVVVPESDFTESIQAHTRLTLWLTLGVLVFMTVLVILIANKINAAMSRLSVASQAIAQGNLEQTVYGSAIRELDTVAQAFNHMSRELQQSYAQLKDYSESLESKVQERTQALEAEVRDRQRSEQQYRTLVTNIPGAVYRGTLDDHWTIVFISEAIAEITGYPASDFIQNHVRHYRDIIFPEDQDYVATTVNDALAQRSPFILTYRILHADGGLRWVYTKGQGNFDADGDEVWLDGVMFDITQQKLAEETVQRRAAMEHLLSQTSHAFLDSDLDSAINLALQKLGQFTESDRTCIFQFSDPGHFRMTHEWCREGVPSFISERQDIHAENQPWFYEQLLNGRPFQVHQLADLPPNATAEKAEFERQSIQSLLNVPMMYAEKTVGFIGLDTVYQAKRWTPEDIYTLKLVGEMIAMSQARQAAEAALKQSKEAAEVASQAKSTFLASMSHELRTPLNAILGFAQIMQRDLLRATFPRDAADHLQIIQNSGEHLLSLINDVLDVSKIEAGQVTLHQQSLDLHFLLQSLEEMFKLKAGEKGLQLIVAIDTAVPQYVKTDAAKLRQVLINLLGNAIKFTQAGQVQLRVRTVDGETPRPSLRLHFEVEDTGPGIASGELETLFKPFQQTEVGRQSQSGTGLGLTISQKFVELLGGHLQVQSTLGVGSVFSFDCQVTLTEGAPSSAEPQKPKAIALAPNQPTYRILIVEDQWESRLLLVKLLKPLGFTVREATNGREAVQICEQWQPHLIWMDMRMPIMDGYEATQRIRAQVSEQAPIIIALTASALEQEKASVLASGCNDFVRKPFRASVLLDKIQQYLGVRYIYAESATAEQVGATEQENAVPLRADMLTPMPREWVTQLYQAALVADADWIEQLIDAIPQAQTELATALHSLLKKHRCDRIEALAGKHLQ